MIIGFRIDVMDQNIKKKSRELAIKVVRLHKQLSAVKKETVMSEELLRCGAGVGAELIKAECAMDKNDQMARIHKALQNCAEAKYWLELLHETGYISEFEFTDALKICDELGKLLIALVKAMRARRSEQLIKAK